MKKVYYSLHSNTTLVKVKSNSKVTTYDGSKNSNTTLVKVKYVGANKDCLDNIIQIQLLLKLNIIH